MKHNWEYKRLGDVCSFERGVTYSKDDESEFESDVVILRSNNIDLESSSLNFSDLKYLKSCFQIKESKKLKANTILICMSNGSLAHLGKTAFVPQNLNMAFGGFMGLIIPESQNPKYLSYVLRSPIYYSFLDSLNRGANIRNLQFSKLSKLHIPVPPMETQEQIVTELDQINDLIAKNRELLSQLDALAQSLFYDTFGDPTSNPKGWETTIFSNIFKLRSGDGLSAKNIVPGVYPVYGGNGIVGYHNETNLSGCNIIIGRVGALCGNVRLVRGEIFVTDNAFITENKNNLNLIFLERLLIILNLRQYANAAAQPVISNSSLKNIPVILPPLALQEDFAAKVEAIEAQKAKVEAEIAELQTLLDARMDYWFN